MKKYLYTLALPLAMSLSAQAQDLPQPSPSAELEQTVGLTHFTIQYSRPSAKGREIFGGLVPYNKVWRTGANKATSIEFDTPVRFGSEDLPAGKYSLFTIPTEENWTIIFNQNTELWGAGDYEQAEDAARITAQVENDPMTETFTISFENVAEQSADLVMEWAEKKVIIPIEVATREVALGNIKKAIAEADQENQWRVFRNAANYYLNNDIDNAMALDYIDRSIAAKRDSWYSHYIEAQIHQKMGNQEEAWKSANMAIEVGQKTAREAGENFGYAEMIMSNIEGMQ